MEQLTSHLADLGGRPYFLWSDELTVHELRDRLASPDEQERLHWLTVLLREARDRDVWTFVTPARVAAALPLIASKLGRRRSFWEYLIAGWRCDGLLPR